MRDLLRYSVIGTPYQQQRYDSPLLQIPIEDRVGQASINWKIQRIEVALKLDEWNRKIEAGIDQKTSFQ